ncbi:hypothetical protein DPMN_074789 [Dreissena polymorpha]|uniref:Uncharacterized protein n=1 Tax=Dreissena polymorpha TaxID=45954 RepID=A0A9D4BNR5_DREPO|nr:hypothetical protein DPMN_074789 [Dreissena polymorpha]
MCVFQCYPNCMKAHVHMGRAHIGMKEYKEARECFKKALTCDPTKDSLINGACQIKCEKCHPSLACAVCTGSSGTTLPPKLDFRLEETRNSIKAERIVPV